MGHHTWRLLDQGRLKAAARLGHSLVEVGASLPALLLACPEGAREGLPSPDACLAGGSLLDPLVIMSLLDPLVITSLLDLHVITL